METTHSHRNPNTSFVFRYFLDPVQARASAPSREPMDSHQSLHKSAKTGEELLREAEAAAGDDAMLIEVSVSTAADLSLSLCVCVCVRWLLFFCPQRWLSLCSGV